MLSPGAEIVLTLDKAVAGGRMLGRHDGQVILVSGAIPGERVRARITHVSRRVAHGDTVEILEAHPDRRESDIKGACGGAVYAHIKYPRQLSLKSEIVADAFIRIAKSALPRAVTVAPSQEHGYRMRARLHAKDGRIGFFREGTHELCDAAATRQLLPATTSIIDRFVTAAVRERPNQLVSVELAENVPATERVLHMEWRTLDDAARLAELDFTGLTGVTCATQQKTAVDVIQGVPHVTEVLQLPRHDGTTDTELRLRHHVRSFFQGNRWLLQTSVTNVVTQVSSDQVVDLYSGVGVFAVSLAALGRQSVVAVEGNPVSARDLDANAAPYGDAIRVHATAVEEYLRRESNSLEKATVVLNPPRTGLSTEAITGLVARRPPQLVYMSCDVPTLARDVRALMDRGYRLGHLEAFDLFPNTAHVESLAVLTRGE